MSMLLYKSCRPLPRSRIRQISGCRHPLSLSSARPQPPWSFFLRSPLPCQLERSPLHLSARSNGNPSLYPMISSYSTLTIQYMPSDTTTTTTTTNDTTSPTPTSTSTSSPSQQRGPSLPSSPPLWLKETRIELKKIQRLIDGGNYEQALGRVTTLSYHDDVLTDTAVYSELLDPYAILLEQRLEQGEWDQGLTDFSKLASTPGWGSLLLYNRRAMKAILVLHCAKGNWSSCETMIKQLKITMTATTVARMVGTLMELKTTPTATATTKRTRSKYAIRGQQIVWALQMFERKLRVEVNAEALSRIVGYLGDRGLMEDAYRIYRWARKEHNTNKKVHPNHYPGSTHRASKSILYLTMIDAAIINNDTAKAERIWHERMYRGTFSTNPSTAAFRPASLSSYNVLLNIYASQLPAPNLARVHRTYRRMLNAGHSPSSYTYNILIKAFVNIGKPDLAYQVYDTMMLQQKYHHDDSNNYNRIPPSPPSDSRAINMLLRGWIEKREWHQVEHFVQRLSCDGVRLDQRAFNIMLQGFLQLDGRVMAVEHLLKVHGDWAYWKHLQRSVRKPYTLTSVDLWHIFSAVTGQTKGDFAQQQQQQQQQQQRQRQPTLADTINNNNMSSFGFAALFEHQHQAFNQVSCKLFIKAFTLANDLASADMIKKWMFYSYPPILEKKPLI